jgi:hypothetical protein
MTPDGRALYAGIMALMAGVFLVEILMPLGFTPWLLFVIPLGLTYWAPYLYAPLVIATACTVLVVLGYFLSPVGVYTPIAVTNRAFGTLTLWVLAFLILQYKILGNRLSQLTITLGSELTERTRDLGLAVAALQQEMQDRIMTSGDASLARTELERQVTNVLTAEGRRLQEKIARYEHVEQAVPGGEERLDLTRNELVQLGQRLERLQRELLDDKRD